jgi:uncharacterized protein (TIGR02246 family)
LCGQEVLKLSQTLNDAYVTKDRATLERLLAEDYAYIHSNGTLTTNKAEQIAELMSADLKWTAQKLENMRVRMYGDTAVVTATQTMTGSAKQYVSGPRRMTEIWVRRSGRWQTIGGQNTLVPTK